MMCGIFGRAASELHSGYIVDRSYIVAGSAHYHRDSGRGILPAPRYCYTRCRWIPMPLSDSRVGYSWMGSPVKLAFIEMDIGGILFYERNTHTGMFLQLKCF